MSLQSPTNAQVAVSEFVNPDLAYICTQYKGVDFYAEFLELFCEMAPNQRTLEYASVMWLLVCLACYSEIRYLPKIKVNSCNAGFTFLKCTHASTMKEETLVAKFQLSPNADNIIIDNINGFVMNMLIREFPHVERSVMKYFDSCLTYVRSGTNSRAAPYGDKSSYMPDDAKTLTFPLKNLLLDSNKTLSNDEISKGIDALRSTSFLRRLSLCRSVGDPYAWSTLLYNKIFNFHQICMLLRPLLSSIRTLGEACGFTHNDAHCGNILFDQDEANLVLIDYGRVVFSEKLIAARNIYLIELIDERIQMEQLKDMSEGSACDSIPDASMGYNEFMQSFAPKNFMVQFVDMCETRKYDFMLSHVYLFDIMCIAMNTLMFAMVIGVKDSDLEPVSKFVFISKDVNRDTIVQVQKSTVIRDYIISIESIKYSDTLLLGVYWFAVVAEWFYEKVQDKTKYCISPDTKFSDGLMINMNKMAHARLMHPIMQVIFIPKTEQFCQHIERLHKDIDLVVKKLFDVPVVGGSIITNMKGKHQSSAKKKRCLPKICVKKNIVEAPAMYFDKETRAYVGGGTAEYERLFAAYASSDNNACRR